MTGRCVILIGMPGAGKSTVGVALAKALDAAFIDTDDLVCAESGGTLAELLGQGREAFLKVEAEVLQDLDVEGAVIATGGSVVLDEAAMANLKRLGTVVYIDVPVEVLRERLGDLQARGVVGAEDMTLDEIYAERVPLYKKFADVVVADGAVEDVVGQIWVVL